MADLHRCSVQRQITQDVSGSRSGPFKSSQMLISVHTVRRRSFFLYCFLHMNQYIELIVCFTKVEIYNVAV